MTSVDSCIPRAFPRVLGSMILTWSRQDFTPVNCHSSSVADIHHSSVLSQSLCPAGEINTFQGNLNWVASREHSISNPVWEGRENEFLPLCNAGESDSANLDHVAELLVRTGVPPQEALMVLVPEAYDNHPHLQANYPEVQHTDPTRPNQARADLCCQ